MLETESEFVSTSPSENTSTSETTSTTSCSSSSPEENEENSATPVKNIGGPVWCLIDHPNIWTKLGPRVAEFQNSTRLMSLMGKPRNKIVQFPDSMALARQFYCVMCREIPFPWTGDPEKSENNPEGIFLCSNGHTVCRSCGQCCFTCTASREDASYTSGKDYQTVTETFEPASGSTGLWGQIQLCFQPITSFNCVFLQDMITQTEFACKYFYNWCPFRGIGKNLQAHENECSFRFASCTFDSINNSDKDKQAQPQFQDKKALIFSFRQDVAISETARLLNKHIPNWDQLNPRNRVKVSQKKNRKH